MTVKEVVRRLRDNTITGKRASLEYEKRFGVPPDFPINGDIPELLIEAFETNTPLSVIYKRWPPLPEGTKI